MGGGVFGVGVEEKRLKISNRRHFSCPGERGEGRGEGEDVGEDSGEGEDVGRQDVRAMRKVCILRHSFLFRS